jgi:hypothetical protein
MTHLNPSISCLIRTHFSNVSLYGLLFHMQNASVSDDVDEEQGIGDDGSKSSRSHRALEDSGLRFLALKKGRQLSRLPRWQPLKHMWQVWQNLIEYIIMEDE